MASGPNRSSGTGRILLMPSTTRVSCNSTLPNDGLRADRIVTGVEQRFTIRPNPAIIGIDFVAMPPGGIRTQASRTCGRHSRAATGIDMARAKTTTAARR